MLVAINWPWKKKKQEQVTSDGLVGIHVSPNSISLAYVKGDTPKDIKLEAFKHTSTENADEHEALVKQFVDEHQLEGTPCAYSLHHGEYQLNLIEAPNEADIDRINTIKTALQDMVSSPAEDIDVASFGQNCW